MEKVTILAPVIFTDRKSAKSGNTYRAADVQGLLHTEDGKQEVFAMMLFAPHGEKGEDKPAGTYVPLCAWKVDFRDRKLTSEIVGFKAAAAAPSAVPKAA